MIKFILTKAFPVLIGKFSESEKAEFWNKFNTLLAEVVKAGAAGAIEGVSRR
jgi:hypothetical protein